MNRKQLGHRREALLAEANGIIAAAEAEDRPFSEVERGRLTAIHGAEGSPGELAMVDQDVALLAAAHEAERRASAIIGDNTPPVSMVSMHVRAEDQPWGTATGAAFGEFLVAVKRAKLGGYQDPRLFAAAQGAGEAVDADGGYLVGQDMIVDLTKAINSGAILSRVGRIPLKAGANGVTVRVISETSRATGSRWGAVQGYWVDEGTAPTASRPKFAKVDLKFQKIAALGYDTGELEEDATAFQSVITEAFRDELQFMVEDAIFNGDGAGKPQGILNAAALVSVAKETGQAAATIVTANLSKMWARFSGRNPVWFINRDTNPQLDLLSIPAGTGALEPRFVNYGPDGLLRIKGAAVVETEYNATIGTVGDIVLADMSAYGYIDGGGVKQAQSLHVAFTTDEMAFRATMRCDGQVMPRAALTPFKGTANTRSPFVALATRA